MESVKLFPVAHFDFMVEDAGILELVKDMLRNLKGVHDVHVSVDAPSELDLSIQEAQQGQTTEVGTVADLMKYLQD